MMRPEVLDAASRWSSLNVVLFLAVLAVVDPAPLYCFSSEPDYVGIKKSNHFHPFYSGSRDSRTAQLAVWML